MFIQLRFSAYYLMSVWKKIFNKRLAFSPLYHDFYVPPYIYLCQLLQMTAIKHFLIAAFKQLLRSFFLYWLLLKRFIYMSWLWSTNKVLEFSLSENKIKKTSNNIQIFSLWNAFLLNFDIWLFKLRMQACTIFLTAIVNMSNISCLLNLEGKRNIQKQPPEVFCKKVFLEIS